MFNLIFLTTTFWSFSHLGAVITQTVFNIRLCNFRCCLPSLCWMRNLWILCCFEILINLDISIANRKHYIFKSYKRNIQKILVQVHRMILSQKCAENTLFLCWVVFKIQMPPWWTKRWCPFSRQLNANKCFHMNNTIFGSERIEPP